MIISEPAVIVGAGTAVLAILFGARLVMRAMAGDAGAPPTGGEALTAGGLGEPDVAGVIAVPPLIFLAFLAAATVLEAVVGIVSKRLGSHYRSGRSPHWLKIKNPHAPPRSARLKKIGGDE